MSQPLRRTETYVRPIVQHHTYYLPGGDLYLLADNTIFRIHRHFFEEGSLTFFRDLYPPYDGTSPAAAYPLIGTRPDDLALFLWTFYNPFYSLYETSQRNWWTIYSLAFKWNFPQVMEHASRHITTTSPPATLHYDLPGSDDTAAPTTDKDHEVRDFTA